MKLTLKYPQKENIPREIELVRGGEDRGSLSDYAQSVHHPYANNIVRGKQEEI